jgi:hypothetical protein
MMSGGPGAIRTPDPQIRRLRQSIDSKHFFPQPSLDLLVSDQGITDRLQTGNDGPENENPGALAGATGADTLPKKLCAEDYKMRAEAATALCEAIGECHPDDAVQIMTAALTSLCPPGEPGEYFISTQEDAAWWASCEAPFRLVAVVEAALARLGDVALHLRHRKTLIVSLFQSLPVADRRAFMAKVDPAGNFTRAAPQ